MEKLFSIQEVSQMLGIPKDTLRYYDRIGIVSPLRDDNQYRKYTNNDLIDLMNIQMMQYADFSLKEIEGKFDFHKVENVDPAKCEAVAAFLDEKNAEIQEKIKHLQRISQLLNMTADTLRDPYHESNQQLGAFVRELYKDVYKHEPPILKGGCEKHQE